MLLFVSAEIPIYIVFLANVGAQANEIKLGTESFGSYSNYIKKVSAG